MVIQLHARETHQPLDVLRFQCDIRAPDAPPPSCRPEKGIYVDGLHLEGARWDADNACLAESHPHQLRDAMPVMWLYPEAEQELARAGRTSSSGASPPRRSSMLARDLQMLQRTKPDTVGVVAPRSAARSTIAGADWRMPLPLSPLAASSGAAQPYLCPVYRTTTRGSVGAQGTSAAFLIALNLPTQGHPPAFWIRRSVALVAA